MQYGAVTSLSKHFCDILTLSLYHPKKSLEKYK